MAEEKEFEIKTPYDDPAEGEMEPDDSAMGAGAADDGEEG